MHEGSHLMDYQLSHNGQITPFINSMLYAYEESGRMDNATVLFICRAVKPGMPNIRFDRLMKALKASAKSAEALKAVEALEQQLDEKK